MKKSLQGYYTKEYFKNRDILDIHLASTIKYLLTKNKMRKILDVGCGTGRFVSYLYKKGFSAWGLEPQDSAIRVARKRNKGKIVKGDVSHLPFPKNSFDAVSAISVVEHLTKNEMDRFLRETCRILRKNGLIFLVTPNFATPIRWFHGRRWFGYSDPTHINFYTPWNLSALLQKYGFGRIRFTFRTIYNPPYTWDMPNFVNNFPPVIRSLITFLFISTPFSLIRNSFWIAGWKENAQR